MTTPNQLDEQSIDAQAEAIQETLRTYFRAIPPALPSYIGGMPRKKADRDLLDALEDKVRAMSKKLAKPKRFVEAPTKITITAETPCMRCGCKKTDHSLKGSCSRCRPGGERRGICHRFIGSNDGYSLQFFDFTKWAKAWVNVKSSRSVSKLSRIWSKLHNFGYCSYCHQCQDPIILYDTSTKVVAKVQDGLACPSCKRCETCCDCPDCARCMRPCRAVAMCKTCKSCLNERCCRCKTCRLCKTECGDDHCLECGDCNACCKCGDETRVPFYTAYNRPPKFYTPSLKQRSINPSTRFIAAEIEVAGIRGYGRSIYKLVKDWGACVVRDGSLPAGGFEINTSPAGGDLYVQQVNEFCKAVHDQLGFVNNQCGLHVHVDARDLTYYDLRRLIRVYAVIEDTLFDMMPARRKQTKHCLPCGAKYLQSVEEGRLPYEKVRNDVINATYRRFSTQDTRYSKYNQARYHALNLHSYFYRGTIECRMFDGSIDPDEIIKWGMLWARLLDYVVITSDEEIAKLVLDRSGLEVLKEICVTGNGLFEFIEKRLKKQEAAKPKMPEKFMAEVAVPPAPIWFDPLPGFDPA